MTTRFQLTLLAITGTSVLFVAGPEPILGDDQRRPPLEQKLVPGDLEQRVDSGITQRIGGGDIRQWIGAAEGISQIIGGQGGIDQRIGGPAGIHQTIGNGRIDQRVGGIEQSIRPTDLGRLLGGVERLLGGSRPTNTSRGLPEDNDRQTMIRRGIDERAARREARRQRRLDKLNERRAMDK